MICICGHQRRRHTAFSGCLGTDGSSPSDCDCERFDEVHEVDGIFFQREGTVLVISFKVEGDFKVLRVQENNAREMARVMGKLYLEEKR